jgi:predicted lipid-binding transport protein (Tim44 family)
MRTWFHPECLLERLFDPFATDRSFSCLMLRWTTGPIVIDAALRHNTRVERNFFGMGPLGSLLSGALAGVIGILPTFLTFGTICLTAALIFAALLPSFRKAIRPMAQSRHST